MTKTKKTKTNGRKIDKISTSTHISNNKNNQKPSRFHMYSGAIYATFLIFSLPLAGRYMFYYWDGFYGLALGAGGYKFFIQWILIILGIIAIQALFKQKRYIANKMKNKTLSKRLLRLFQAGFLVPLAFVIIGDVFGMQDLGGGFPGGGLVHTYWKILCAGLYVAVGLQISSALYIITNGKHEQLNKAGNILCYIMFIPIILIGLSLYNIAYSSHESSE